MRLQERDEQVSRYAPPLLRVLFLTYSMMFLNKFRQPLPTAEIFVGGVQACFPYSFSDLFSILIFRPIFKTVE